MSDKDEALRLADALLGRAGLMVPILPVATELRRQHAEIEALKEELETERVRLAACGVVAMANTPETAAKFREINPEYRSASCDDVAKAVDREMALRAECDALRAALASAMPTVGMGWIDRAEKAEAECDALRADAERWRYVRRNPWRALDILRGKFSTRTMLWHTEVDDAFDDALKEAGK